MTPAHIVIRHIPYGDPVYKTGLKYLEEEIGARSLVLFEEDPVDRFVKGQILEEFGNSWPAEHVENYIDFCSKINCIDWLVDQLLDTSSEQQRLAVVPVRVVDSNRLKITSHSREGQHWIVVDRALRCFVEYMANLLYLEFFRGVESEFLVAPPSHEEVVHLIVHAGQLFRRGEWSSAVRPISRMHSLGR